MQRAIKYHTFTSQTKIMKNTKLVTAIKRLLKKFTMKEIITASITKVVTAAVVFLLLLNACQKESSSLLTASQSLTISNENTATAQAAILQISHKIFDRFAVMI